MNSEQRKEIVIDGKRLLAVSICNGGCWIWPPNAAREVQNAVESRRSQMGRTAQRLFGKFSGETGKNMT